MKTLKSLSELYEYVALNEANKSEGVIADKTNLSKPSEMEVGDIKADQDFFSDVPKPVEGAETAKGVKELSHKVVSGSTSKPTQGSIGSTSKVPHSAPKSNGFKGTAPAKETEAEEPEETEKGEDVFSKKEKEKHEESYTMSAFENLFKKTLAEELEETPVDETPMDDLSAEGDEMSDDVSDTEDMDEEGEDEGDLLSDLKELQDKLAAILAKLEGGAEENESGEAEGDENYTEEDFDEEFGEEEEGDEDGTFKESVKAKSLPHSKGKKLMSKHNKIGRLKTSGGKAHTGSLKDEPKPKALGDKKAALQKGTEAKSSVKKGEFFK
jgi:hypothetical protein